MKTAQTTMENPPIYEAMMAGGLYPKHVKFPDPTLQQRTQAKKTTAKIWELINKEGGAVIG